MENNDVLAFELTVEEINYVLSLLSQRPYSEVSAFVAKIQAQAQAQMVASVESDAE